MREQRRRYKSAPTPKEDGKGRTIASTSLSSDERERVDALCFLKKKSMSAILKGALLSELSKYAVEIDTIVRMQKNSKAK